MILRTLNKENIVHQQGEAIEIMNKQGTLPLEKDIETLQNRREELSIHEINSQVLQKELIRLSESMEAERINKNGLAHSLAKMEEEVKILKV